MTATGTLFGPPSGPCGHRWGWDNKVCAKPAGHEGGHMTKARNAGCSRSVDDTCAPEYLEATA